MVHWQTMCVLLLFLTAPALFGSGHIKITDGFYQEFNPLHVVLELYYKIMTNLILGYSIKKGLVKGTPPLINNNNIVIHFDCKLSGISLHHQEFAVPIITTLLLLWTFGQFLHRNEKVSL